MIKSSTIINFQSHVKSYLEFHPNVNVIFGLSDSGKSAWVRAFDSIFNRSPFYIRKKQEEGKIEFELDDCKISRTFSISKLRKCPACSEKLKGMVCICKCGEILEPNVKEDIYLFDGTEYKKFGVKIPDFILKKTKIFPIDFVDFQENLQLSYQHGDMFFISPSYSGNKRNKIISSLIPDSEKVDFVIKQLNSEIPKETTELEFHIEKKKIQEEKLDKIKEEFELTSKLNEEFDRIKIENEKQKSDLLIIKDIFCKLNELNKVLRVKEPLRKTDYHFKVLNDLFSNQIILKKENEQLNYFFKLKSEINKVLRIKDQIKKNDSDFKNIPVTVLTLSNDKVALSRLKDLYKQLKQTSRFVGVKFETLDNINIIFENINNLTKEYTELTTKALYIKKNKLEIISLQEEIRVVAMEIKTEIKNNPICNITGKEYCQECKKELGIN